MVVAVDSAVEVMFICSQRIGHGITVRFDFEEKDGSKLRTIFSGILRYTTKIRCYFFCTVPNSSRRLI